MLYFIGHVKVIENTLIELKTPAVPFAYQYVKSYADLTKNYKTKRDNV